MLPQSPSLAHLSKQELGSEELSFLLLSFFLLAKSRSLDFARDDSADGSIA